MPLNTSPLQSEQPLPAAECMKYLSCPQIGKSRTGEKISACTWKYAACHNSFEKQFEMTHLSSPVLPPSNIYTHQPMHHHGEWKDVESTTGTSSYMHLIVTQCWKWWHWNFPIPTDPILDCGIVVGYIAVDEMQTLGMVYSLQVWCQLFA